MRTSDQKVNPILANQVNQAFFQLLADLKEPKDVALFLNDFFNQSEFETFTKRLAIAYWLKKGRSYVNIKANLKVSSATIATIQSQMKAPGLKLALKMLEADEWANQWSKRIKKVLKK